MREKQPMRLVISHAFIAIGCFLLYGYHVRSIFETRTNFAHMSNLQREALLQKEDALYFSFYKTIVEETDFYSGYRKLLNVTTIEYPQGINVVQRFDIFPEIVIGYFYHKFRRISKSFDIPIMTCWTDDHNINSEPYFTCDGLGEPFHFYLEFVWMFGSFTVFIIYMYATFLSETLFGGIYAVVSYVIFHKNVSKIYDRPLARENFAFPLIFWQIFYLCLCLSSDSKSKKTNLSNYRPFKIFKLTALTTASLVSWQFASVIYATQALLLIIPRGLGIVGKRLTIEYSLSQFFSIILAYYITYENKKFFFAWQNGPVFSILITSLYQFYVNDNGMRHIAFCIFEAICAQGTIVDFLVKTGFANFPFVVYRDLVFHWALQRRANFSTSLLACNPEFSTVDIHDVSQVVKVLFAKPFCLYGVVLLAKFLRKWRIQSPKSENKEYVERAKKYVLEDFLEENRISMKEMSDEKTEKALVDCLALLEKCDYDFKKYKEESSKMNKKDGNEHQMFLNEIKLLKQQINTHKDQHAEANQDNVDNFKSNNSTETELGQKPTESAPNSPQQDLTNKLGKSQPSTENQNEKTDSLQENDSKKPRAKTNQKKEIDLFYFYSLTQFCVFISIGLNIKKLFFLCYTLGCVLAPTLYSKLRSTKHNNWFLTTSLFVFIISIINPGIENVYEEYLPSKSQTDDLVNMLEWININTEKNAVFGGPIDVIGTVHLATKRPIVNHAVLDMHLSERTESVYSIYSRQQSSEIFNQFSQLQVQYVILSFRDCLNFSNDECDISTIWDGMQPANRKYPRFCSELLVKNIPSFQKVYINVQYGIFKIFSQSVQLNLKHSKMPEKFM